MSEILIKNMALPKQGWKRLILLPDGEVREICGDEAIRATDARAVELPEHGRLGDLDILEKQAISEAYFPSEEWATVIELIKGAPTVLGASK